MIGQHKLGVVLGAGVARGWAHIGVLQALTAQGLRPDIVCGCSIGGLVGASYVTGHLDKLSELVTRLSWRGVLRYMDFSFAGGGLIEGKRVVKFFTDNVENTDMEHARPVFGTVATELHTGRETWLTSGSIIDAVRASIALPGLLTPVNVKGKWLVDGALVNPLPVSLCRALGADIIMGVSLSGDLMSRPRTLRGEPSLLNDEVSDYSNWLRWPSRTSRRADAMKGPHFADPDTAIEPDRPGYIEVIGESFFIVQDFVSRVRLAADPVDVLIAPNVSKIGVMEFHRAKEAIEAGHAAVKAAEASISAACLAGAQEPVHTDRPAGRSGGGG